MTNNNKPTAEDKFLEAFGIGIRMSVSSFEEKVEKFLKIYQEEIEQEIREDERRKVIEEIESNLFEIYREGVRHGEQGIEVIEQTPDLKKKIAELGKLLSQLK